MNQEQNMLLLQLNYIRVFHMIKRPNCFLNQTNSTVSELFGLLPSYVTQKHMSADEEITTRHLRKVLAAVAHLSFYFLFNVLTFELLWLILFSLLGHCLF